MRIENRGNRLELIIKEDAVFEEYEDTINYLMQVLALKDIREINDFGERYQLFQYEDHTVVLFYSNFLGLSIYVQDNAKDVKLQTKILEDFYNVLLSKQF